MVNIRGNGSLFNEEFSRHELFVRNLYYKNGFSLVLNN